MSEYSPSDLETSLTMLFNRIEPPKLYRKAEDGDKEPTLVFLLGAGCSRQYGLPSFRELLTYLWEDFFRRPPDPNWSFEVLRDGLDKYWQSKGPEDRRQVLEFYLKRMDGAFCPGYRQLAKLAQQGYVKAIVNMNFDTLLEEALEYEALLDSNFDYRVFTSFQMKTNHLPIYKPHGTIGRVDSGDGLDEMIHVCQEIIDTSFKVSQTHIHDFRRARNDFADELVAKNSTAGEGVVETAQRLCQSLEEFEFCFRRQSDSPLIDVPKDLRAAMQRDIGILRKNRLKPIKLKNDLILDIANSDLFSDPNEQQSAQELLTGHDVVCIGYSGVDAKVAAALRAFSQAKNKNPRDQKLFVINANRPDPRLLFVMAERGSQDLLVTGEDAAFENFMEHIGDELDRWKEIQSDETSKARKIGLPAYAKRVELARSLRSILDISGEEADAAIVNFFSYTSFVFRPSPGVVFDKIKPLSSWRGLSFMTRSERVALARVLKLAMEIRLSLDVAERSKMSIEEHGYEVYGLCSELARNAGVCLTSPEKYLLHSAAFLHDLGYYLGYSRGKILENPGWKLLRWHGKMTEILLEESFQNGETCRDIVPTSYGAYGDQDERIVFLDILKKLCAGHNRVRPAAELEDRTLKVGEFDVPVRFYLLHALFSAAEELSESHPFRASSDPVSTFEESAGLWAIKDPVLEMYLDRKRYEVSFPKERGRVYGLRNRVHERSRESSDAALRWFLSIAACAVRQFDEVARKHPKVERWENCRGWGMKFIAEIDIDDTIEEIEDVASLVQEALEDGLREALQNIKPGSLAEATLIFDLLAIYTLDHQRGMVKDAHMEPRVDLGRSVVKAALARALERLDAEPNSAYQNLLQYYFPIKSAGVGVGGKMEVVFLDSFERIIYPAWRFLARNWHDGIEATLAGRACLDLGSTGFRSEVISGLRGLIGEKVYDGKKEDGDKPEWSFGHQKCTLCTSRLLFTFSMARRLFPEGNLDYFSQNERHKGLNETVGGMLAYMIDLDPQSQAWWGLGSELGRESAIRSGDYLAWAARAVMRCLEVDREIEKKTGQSWLEEDCKVDRAKVRELFRQRWDQIFAIDSPKSLMTDKAEEPHSYVLGHIALAGLELLHLESDLRTLALKGGLERLARLADILGESKRMIGVFSHLSSLFLWPVGVLKDSIEPKPEHATEIAELCCRCLYSPVWIPEGRAEAGTWGSNVKNTQVLVTSLATFWRYVFRDEENRQRFGSVFEDLPHEISRL